MSEKLQKVLARTGCGSRRKIEKIINDGRISIAGQVAKLGDRIAVSSSMKIRIDGHLIPVKRKEELVCRVLLYYKPEGEICTYSDPGGRQTVFDRLPNLRFSRWISVGRLDINTSGLLLFTTDGQLANGLMHPSSKVEREYAVRVFGWHDQNTVQKLKQGVKLEDGLAAFKKIDFQGGEEGLNKWYNVTLTEGRNREVHRLWESVGVRVSRLIRVRYGDIVLPKWLPRGGWIELDLKSTNHLRRLVNLKLETNSKVSEKLEDCRINNKKIGRAVRSYTKVADSNKCHNVEYRKYRNIRKNF